MTDIRRRFVPESKVGDWTAKQIAQMATGRHRELVAESLGVKKGKLAQPDRMVQISKMKIPMATESFVGPETCRKVVPRPRSRLPVVVQIAIRYWAMKLRLSKDFCMPIYPLVVERFPPA
jgi:hypothetical protein